MQDAKCTTSISSERPPHDCGMKIINHAALELNDSTVCPVMLVMNGNDSPSRGTMFLKKLGGRHGQIRTRTARLLALQSLW